MNLCRRPSMGAMRKPSQSAERIVAGLERLARRACADEYGIYDPDAGRERYRSWWD